MTATDTSPGRRRWWQQPSLHFLLIGIVLFAAYRWLETRQGADGKTIVVDREALLNYMQYRARSFDPARSLEMLDSLGEEELAALIDDYVREEVLYREALALGLDRNDFVIRQRLIQKLEFINRDLTEEMAELTDEEVQRYFAAHRDRYTEPARVTFTHVFFGNHDGETDASRDSDGLGKVESAANQDALIARAESTLSELNARQVGADDAAPYGDDLADGIKFVGQSPDEVVRSFGQEFSDAVFALDAQPDRWQGPLESPDGSHLLLITELTPERMLELAEAEKPLREDARRDRIDERNQAILQEIVDAYDVQITYRPGPTEEPDEASGTQP